MRTAQKFYTPVSQKNELHHNENFSISYKQKKLRIYHKVIFKWIRTRCIAVEYQLASSEPNCGARLTLQKSATKFYNQTLIFPPDSL